MPGKRYSAGAIFLQVVPVFANVQRAIEDEAKSIDRALGDQMEESGKRAGDRAGKAMADNLEKHADDAGEKAGKKYAGHFETQVKNAVNSAQKEIDRLDFKTASDNSLKDLARVKKALSELKDTDFSVDFDSKRVLAQIAEVNAALDRMASADHDINIQANLQKMRADLKRVDEMVARTVEKRRELNIEVKAEFKQAERAIGNFEKSFKRAAKNAADSLGDSIDPAVREIKAQLDELTNVDIGIDVSAERARVELNAIAADLKHLSMESVNIDVKADTGHAYADLAAFQAALNRIDGEDVTVDVNTDGVVTSTNRAKRSADEAANSFRSFNGILLLVAGAGPALIPILGAIAGGLLAIGPAAAVGAAGLGSVLIGFSGLGDAITALQNRQDQATTTAQTAQKQQVSAAHAIADAHDALADAERNAGRAAKDSAKAVADARRQASEAIRNALQRQQEAQRSYAQSVQDVKDAEQDLRDARKAAADDGADLQRQIHQNQLAIDQALIDSFNATVNYNATMADGSATNLDKEQARIDREQALANLEDLRAAQKDLAEEKAKWDKGGVNGTDAVKTAQDKLNDALAQQKQDYRDLKDAAHDVDQARAKGAESVRQALLQQNRTLADNARAVAKAKEGLARARESAAATYGAINSQQQAVNNAFANLGPAGKHFALFLFSLRKGFYAFRDDIQEVMLPAVEEAINGLLNSKTGGAVRDLLVTMAGAFGQFVKALSRSFQGPVWLEFFRTMAEVGPEISKAYGHAFIMVLEALASILTTLAPFSLAFARGLDAIATAFARWADSQAGQDAILAFLDYVHGVGPSVLDAIVALAGAMGKLLVAMAPFGGEVLSLLTKFFNLIGDLATGPLAGFVGSILTLITASQLAYAAMNLFMAGGALLASTLGLVIFTLVGAALGLYQIWQRSHTVAIVLGALAAVIGTIITVQAAWAFVTGIVVAVQATLAGETYAVAAATKAQAIAQRAAIAVTKAFMAAQVALEAVMAGNPFALAVIAIIALVAAFVILYKKNESFRKAVQKVWAAIKKTFGVAIDAIKVALEAMGEAVMWVWDKALRPTFTAMGKAIAWLWTNAFAPVLEAIGAAFRVTFTVISWLWNNILWPVLKVIGKVIWNLWKIEFRVALISILALFKATFLGIKLLWNKVLHPVFKVIGKVMGWLWKNVFKPNLTFMGNLFSKVFKGMKVVWDKVLHPVFSAIIDTVMPKLKTAFRTTVEAIGKIWDGLKKIVAAPIKFVLKTVLNDGIIAGFNKLAHWVHMDGIDDIKIPKGIDAAYARGGVLPGYTPGRDVHHFASPTGGQLHLSGGEAIMRPEWTAAVGPGFVNYMNRVAASGGVKAVRSALGEAGSHFFASGGIFKNPDDKVYLNGMAISRVAAAQVALARQMSRIPIYMMQGGYGGNHVAASGSSHNYPGVGDFAPGSIALERVMRQVGFAAWARNVPGRSLVGSGAHVHAVSLLDPGDRRSPQVYGSWANHGNGLSGAGNDPAPHYSWVPGLMAKIASMGIGQITSLVGGKGDGGGWGLPKKVMSVAKNPIGWVKGLIEKPLHAFHERFGSGGLAGEIGKIPGALVKGIAKKAIGIIPGGEQILSTIGKGVDVIKDVGGAIGHGAAAVGDALGFANGGILPYNGTMKYDNGGYLPPGLTNVVNLTGRPEPVFTGDQFDRMGGAPGGNIHYEPHFEGTNLTAEDIASDLNFTFRRMRRRGKYEGVGS